MRLSLEQLLQKARELSANGTKWHHHYLPPGCSLNHNPEHQIILEAGPDLWTAESPDSLLDYLQQLENLFFTDKLKAGLDR